MVDFIGTTPSETGSTGEGGTTDFSRRLDTATLAAVSDPTAEEGGIEGILDAELGNSELHHGGVMRPSDERIRSILDVEFGNPELHHGGVMRPLDDEVDGDEWRGGGIRSFLSNDVDGSELRHGGVMGTLSAENGDEKLRGDGIDSFLRDAVDSTEVRLGGGGIRIVAPEIGTFNNSEQYASPASDLVRNFPIPVSLKQAEFLIRAYDPSLQGSPRIIIEKMKADGALVADTSEDGGYIAGSEIGGAKIAAALWNAAGATSSTPLTAKQFHKAITILFGDVADLSPQMAAFLTNAFGTDGTMNLKQAAAIFDSDAIRLHFNSFRDYADVEVRPYYVPVRVDNETVAAFVISFDQNNDGLLSQRELTSNNQPRRFYFAANSNAWGNDFATLATYMGAYGKKDSTGAMVLDIEAVKAMLTDGSLVPPATTDSWDTAFTIKLDAVPYDRMIWGASYGDSPPLNGRLMSEDGLIKMFGRLGETVSSEQAKFLINVYGDGTYVTPTNVRQMRDDGLLTTGTVAGEDVTLNYNNIDGVLLSRAIFKKIGVDPDAAKATLTGEQFGAGFKLLYGTIPHQALTDPTGLATVFGTKNTLTVAQMGSALNGHNVDYSVPYVPGRRAGITFDGFTGIRRTPKLVKAFHTTGWWSSILKFAGDEAKDVVSTISTIAGVSEDVVAGILNGKLSVEAGLAKGGYKIISAIAAAIAKGENSAKKLIDTMGTAINAAIKDLSTEGKAMIADLIKAAKEGASEVAIRTLSMLSGMSPADAKKAIESIASKGKMVDFAKNLTFDDMKAMVPDYDKVIADLKEQVALLAAAIHSDPAGLQALAGMGYTFNADKQMMKGGQVLSEAETQDVFAKHFRADLAIEINAGRTNALALDGLQFRVFVDYAGKDEDGNDKIQFRIRVLAESGAQATVREGDYGSVGVDAGLVTVHDLVMSWSVPAVGDATKNDVLWNSSIALIGEADATLNLSTLFGRDIEGDAIPKPSAFNGEAGLEWGFGGGFTVSYNLTKLGDQSWKPFLSEVGGAAVGVAASIGVFLGAEALTEGGITAFLELYGLPIVQAGAMVGGFAADLIYAAADTNKDHVSVLSGFFGWVALRSGLAYADPESTDTLKLRVRGQINISNDPWMMM